MLSPHNASKFNLNITSLYKSGDPVGSKQKHYITSKRRKKHKTKLETAHSDEQKEILQQQTDALWTHFLFIMSLGLSEMELQQCC